MAYLGTPPRDKVLTSADIAEGAVTLNDISFTDQPANLDITGTYDKHTMRLADGITVVGDVTITDNLILSKISDDGNAITLTNDSSTRTITGTGSLEASTLTQTPNASLTGMTGELGSAVTGSPAITGVGTLTSGSIASTVTGFTGIKYASLWRVHTNWTNTTSAATTDPVINWEKDDTYGQGTIGSDITESSGVFTFPSTGIWDVIFYHNWSITGSIRFTSAYIMVTTNNSSYSEASMSRSTATMVGNSSTMNNNFCNKLLDVSDTANVKVRFKVDIQTNASNDVINKGETNRNDTYAVFTRIGDT